MFPQLPRYEAVSRRRFLQGSLLVGAVALVPGIACSDEADDAKALQAGGASTTVATAPAATDPATTDAATTGAGAVPAETAAEATTAPPTASPPTASGDPLPAGAQVQVAFTYAAEGGRVRNPYIAVWIETADGDLVQTLSLWYNPREGKYVSHLKRWYNAESSLLDGGGADNTGAISGATRAAGDFQLVWDGTDVAGSAVGQGDYVVCIEAAREHGPYSLTTGTLQVGTAPVTVELPDNGELSAASAAFVA